MEATATLVLAGASLLIAAMRTVLIWRLSKMADRSGRFVRISGLNPLATRVEYGPASELITLREPAAVSSLPHAGLTAQRWANEEVVRLCNVTKSNSQPGPTSPRHRESPLSDAKASKNL